MGYYYFAAGHCYGCGRLFTFNPELVPSVRVEGSREPICGSCVGAANPRREENGLEPIRVLPGAYDVVAAPEHPYDDFLEEGS